jgi:hypothetical protein
MDSVSQPSACRSFVASGASPVVAAAAALLLLLLLLLLPLRFHFCFPMMDQIRLSLL